jgi:hypothetical protein
VRQAGLRRRSQRTGVSTACAGGAAAHDSSRPTRLAVVGKAGRAVRIPAGRTTWTSCSGPLISASCGWSRRAAMESLATRLALLGHWADYSALQPIVTWTVGWTSPPGRTRQPTRFDTLRALPVRPARPPRTSLPSSASCPKRSSRSGLGTEPRRKRAARPVHPGQARPRSSGWPPAPDPGGRAGTDTGAATPCSTNPCPSCRVP